MYSRRRLRRLLSTVPFDIKKVRYLAAGDDSTVYLCDNKYAVKIPRHEAAAESQKREFELYRFLETHTLPAQIPRCLWMGERFNVMDYIPGDPITPKDYHRLTEREKERLAADEAFFLRKLHAIDWTEMNFCEAAEDKRISFTREQEELTGILKHCGHLSAQIEIKIRLIYENLLASDFLFRYIHCLVHNDFSRSNMVFRDKRLAGVIDFGDFRISDPDNDFLCLLDGSNDDFGMAFGMRVLKFYEHPAPQMALRKAQLYNAYWPIQQILYGARRKNRTLFRCGLRALPKLNPQDFIP